MKATEARKLMKSAQEAQVSVEKVERLTRLAHEKIAAAARKNFNKITDPLAGVRAAITDAEKEAVWKRLRADGYKVTRRTENGRKRFYVSW